MVKYFSKSFKHAKKMLNNESGATSVLLVFMMIVLVTLGTFAMTSALVNFKFAQNAASWKQMFYKMETKAENFTKDVDGAVFEALTQVENVSFQTGRSGELSEALVQEVLTDEYKFALDGKFRALSEKYKDVVITEKDGLKIATCEFVSDDNKDAHLTISIAAMPLPKFRLNSNRNAISLEKTGQRFDVLAWRQWQTPTQIDENQEVWDGNPKVEKGKGLFDNPPPKTSDQPAISGQPAPQEPPTDDMEIVTEPPADDMEIVTETPTQSPTQAGTPTPTDAKGVITLE